MQRRLYETIQSNRALKKPSEEGFKHPNYSAGWIVPTGQTDSQEPQSMQVSLISYLSSPSLIAPTGHTEAQEPHLIHSSPITLMIGHLQKIY